MLDIHFHILWGIDDGPASRAETINLARAAVEAGTTGVAATSHVSWDWPENRATTLRTRIDLTRAALSEESIPLEVFAGAEIALTRAVELEDDELLAMTLGHGPWLLIEPPVLPGAAGIDSMFRTLRARGHSIVIAHPERCPAFHREPDLLNQLVSMGMVCSITARSLTGAFGKTVKRFTESMLREGLVHNVASDAHDVRRRTPDLEGQLRKTNLSEGERQRLGQDSGQALLAGTQLPRPRPGSGARSSWLQRVRRH